MKLVQLPVSKVILDLESIVMIGKTGFSEYHVVLKDSPAMPKIGDVDVALLLGKLSFEALEAPAEAPKAVIAKA